MEQQPPEERPYKLYEDPALLIAAEDDHHLALLLEGQQKAEEIAKRQPENPTYAEVAMAAEEGVRGWIKQQDYHTTENAPEDGTD